MISTFAHIMAQVAADNPALYQYGPLGIICAFFMWRDVARDKEREKERKEFLSEIRGLSHRIDGMSKAQLMDICSRENAGTHLYRYAKEAIAKIDAREVKDGLTA